MAQETKPYRLLVSLLLAAAYLLLAYQVVNARQTLADSNHNLSHPGRLPLQTQPVQTEATPTPLGSVIPPTRPLMVVSPRFVHFTVILNEPRVMTQTLAIGNAGSQPLTWTVSISDKPLTGPGTLWMGLELWPITGVNTGTVYVRANSAPYTSTGVFTALLWIRAAPSNTLGAPITVPVSLDVLEDWQRIFLPLILRSYSPPPLPIPQPTITPTTPNTTALGLDFITSAEAPASVLRFQRAAETGAQWDRWPFYWGSIETSDGVFDWSRQDAAVSADVEHRLQLDAILMIPPAFHRKGPCGGLAERVYSVPPRIGPVHRQEAMRAPLQRVELASNDCTTPANLDQPVFTDGTDRPAPGKTINPNNPWARFVYAAVMRYKPGGALAAERGWAADQGVRVWEVWNEPDYTWFWNGNAADYARTVAVAFLAARQADPDARVLLGGLSDVNQRPNWLQDTLDVIATFPQKRSHAWFFDAVPIHSYAWSWATWRHLYMAQTQLDNHGIVSKTLWVNESGVPVWDDYPGPTWDPNSPYRATKLEQADYVIQNIVYAQWMKAEAVFYFQLYDDCGNGADAHDAFGLRRNDAQAVCYPSDEGARPSLAAYQAAARYLRRLTPKWRWRPPASGDPPLSSQEWLAFYDSVEGKRVVALWSRVYADQTAVLTAASSSAILVTPDGITQTLAAVNGQYTLTLPAATNHNTPTDDGSAPIGGQPLLLIEADPSGSGGPRPTGASTNP